MGVTQMKGLTFMVITEYSDWNNNKKKRQEQIKYRVYINNCMC